MPSPVEAVFTDSSTASATTAAVAVTLVGSNVAAASDDKLMKVVSAAMECGGAGEYHLFIAAAGDDSDPDVITSVLRTYTGNTTPPTFADEVYVAKAIGDTLWLKHPIAVSVHLRAFVQFG